MPTIMAESVELLRDINQRQSSLPIFNVDPQYYTGTDATVEPNIETRGGRINSILRQRLGIRIPSNRQ